MDKPVFSSLGLSAEILKAVEALGFEQASPIQAAAIPILLGGQDVFGQSQTGSGKTAAFAIPALEKVDPADRGVQVLILCPTRELATQVADEVHKLAAFKRGIHAVPIYGGASYERQFYELNKGVQVVIGTPGRLIDHLERGTLHLDALKMVILDEADRMLDMGFREDIERILDATPKERQTVFFSATLSKTIQDLLKRYSHDTQMVKIEQKEVAAPAIEQWFYEVHHRAKIEALLRLVDYHGFKLGIIFCNTQRMVDELADTLMGQGFSADRLHGGISQAQRTRVMNKFKKAEFEFLVATDVAARGIDVDDLELVVNYDLPYDAEDYVHRIGRTGRAGKRGMAVTFVSGRDIYKLQFIERYTKTKIRRGTLPTAGEVESKKVDSLLAQVRAVLDSGAASAQSPLVDRLLEEGFSSTDLAASLFHLLTGGANPDAKTPEPKRDEPKPRREREDRPPGEERAPREEFRAERPPREDRAPREESAERQARPAADLGRPAPGKQWISLSVGRAENFGPREIVTLIADTGLPGRAVGTIELGDTLSYAQVPEQYAKGLDPAGSTLTWEGGEVTVTPVRAERKSAFAREKPAFAKGKPSFKGKRSYEDRRSFDRGPAAFGQKKFKKKW